MALLFPTAPTNGQVYTDGNREWTWDLVAWHASTPAVTAQPLDADLTAIAALTGVGMATRTAANLWSLRTIGAGTDISVANADGAAGNPTISVGPSVVRDARAVNTGTGLTGGGDLTADRTLALTGQALALHNLAANGFIVRTAAGVVAARTLVAGADIDLTNADGVAGNPSIAVGTSVVRTTYTLTAGAGIAALGNLSAPRTVALTGRALAMHNLTGLGFIVQTSAGVYNNRDIIGGDGINLTNGDAVAGNPNVAVDSSVVRTTRKVDAGNGLTTTGSGQLNADRVITLGTPSPITSTSPDAVSAVSHTHSLSETAVRNLIAQGTIGQLGTYAILRRQANQAITKGTLYNGSVLNYAGGNSKQDDYNALLELGDNSSPGGQWEARGSIGAESTRYSYTLFVRVT